jgi:hypothetical protein
MFAKGSSLRSDAASLPRVAARSFDPTSEAPRLVDGGLHVTQRYHFTIK